MSPDSSNKVNIQYHGPSRASIRARSLGKDRREPRLHPEIPTRWREGAIRTSSVRKVKKKREFFLLMLQPPKRVGMSASFLPREYIFIVDVSGSTYGFPLEISKKLLKDLIRNLRPTDKFNVLLFSGGSSSNVRTIPTRETSENIRLCNRTLSTGNTVAAGQSFCLP